MLSNFEKKLVAERSRKWIGPPCWSFQKGYRLSFKEAMSFPSEC